MTHQLSVKPNTQDISAREVLVFFGLKMSLDEKARQKNMEAYAESLFWIKGVREGVREEMRSGAGLDWVLH